MYYNKKIMVLLLCSAPGVLHAQKAEMIIKGKVAPNSKIVQVYFSNNLKLDSARVINGIFEYKSSVDVPVATVIFRGVQRKGFVEAASSSSGVVFFEEPGNISINLPEDGEFATVNGGKANTELNEYNKLNKQLYMQGVAIFNQLKATKSAEEVKILIEKRKAFFSEENELILEFARKHPNSYVALDKALLVARMERDPGKLAELEDVYQTFTGELKLSTLGVQFGQLLISRNGTALGREAIDFNNTDSLGRSISLKSLRGNYVLVDFWASWCVPCRQENPNVLKAYETYKNKKFVVLAVSLDRKNARDKWLKAVKDDHLTYTQIWDPEGLTAKQYLISAIPQNYLIDPNGKIIAINLRGEALQSKLAALLNKYN